MKKALQEIGSIRKIKQINNKTRNEYFIPGVRKMNVSYPFPLNEVQKNYKQLLLLLDIGEESAVLSLLFSVRVL